MFCLFMGTIKSAMHSSTDVALELEPLKIRAAYFFSKVSVHKEVGIL